MKLSVLKHMVLTFLGLQGATQGLKDRKSKYSVPRLALPAEMSRAIPESGLSGVLSWGHRVEVGVHLEVVRACL